MAVNEWIIDYGMIYYVGEDGKKFTGSQTIDGVAYQFDEDGVLVSGFDRIAVHQRQSLYL